MSFDAENILIILGMAMMGVGLWFTVGWWALVVMGGVTIVFGVIIGLQQSTAKARRDGSRGPDR